MGTKRAVLPKAGLSIDSLRITFTRQMWIPETCFRIDFQNLPPTETDPHLRTFYTARKLCLK
jgi:hypothetical protein